MPSPKNLDASSLAVVYDWMTVYGGSERLISAILEIYPQAKLHALLHHAPAFENTPLANLLVRTSFMQSLPAVHRYYRSLLPLMPFAIETMNANDHGVVLSVSHAVAHTIRTDMSQIHISYICTPMRYAWHLRDDYLRLHGLDRPLTSWLARFVLERIRRWDRKHAKHADHLLAISRWTAGRVEQAWGRQARVIYPPVDIERFQPRKQRDDFYLLVMRLVPYKMGLEIVKAFNQLKLPLIVVGAGPEFNHIAKAAGNTVRMLNHQPDPIVTDLMNRAKAFVYMAAEDFGIAMVEAQAAGCPVIAYRQGGAAEIVRNGETGLLYQEQTAESMMDAVSQFERRASSFESQSARQNAARFSRQRFREEFTAYMDPLMNHHH